MGVGNSRVQLAKRAANGAPSKAPKWKAKMPRIKNGIGSKLCLAAARFDCQICKPAEVALGGPAFRIFLTTPHRTTVLHADVTYQLLYRFLDASPLTSFKGGVLDLSFR